MALDSPRVRWSGTSRLAYQPTAVSNGEEGAVYQCISAQFAFRSESLDEIRLADYQRLQLCGKSYRPTNWNSLLGKGRRPPNQFADLFPVTISVGEERREYKVWRSFIASVSDYFDKAFTEPWTESRSGFIHLPDVSQAAFVMFLEWLYSRRIISSDGQEHSHRQPSLNHQAYRSEGEASDLLDAYVFATKYMVPVFKQDVCAPLSTILADPSGALLTGCEVTLAVDNLSGDDPMLRSLLDKFVRDVQTENFDEKSKAKFPQQFLWKAIEQFARLKYNC